MLRYGFYTEVYGGSEIPEEVFHCLANRARAALEALEQRYTVTGSPEARNLALCAVAEVLYRDEAVTATTVGSVSVRYERTGAPVYRAAARYLTIYRGVGA